MASDTFDQKFGNRNKKPTVKMLRLKSLSGISLFSQGSLFSELWRQKPRGPLIKAHSVVWFHSYEDRLPAESPAFLARLHLHRNVTLHKRSPCVFFRRFWDMNFNIYQPPLTNRTRFYLQSFLRRHQYGLQAGTNTAYLTMTTTTSSFAFNCIVNSLTSTVAIWVQL